MVGFQSSGTTVCLRCGLVRRKLLHRLGAWCCVQITTVYSLCDLLGLILVGQQFIFFVGSWNYSLFSLWARELKSVFVVGSWDNTLLSFLCACGTTVYFLCGHVRLVGQQSSLDCGLVGLFRVGFFRVGTAGIELFGCILFSLWDLEVEDRAWDISLLSLWALYGEARGTSVCFLRGLLRLRLVGHQFIFFVGS